MPGRRVAAVAGLLAVLLAACGDGDGRSSEAVRDSASTTVEQSATTGAPAPTSTTPGATGRTTTTTPATATTRPRAGATTTTATGARSGSQALRPAAPGTYRYDTTGGSTFGASTLAFPAVTTLVVDPPSGTRQHATRNLRDPSGNGVATEITLDYRPEGVFLLSLRLTTGFSGVTDVRDLRRLPRCSSWPPGPGRAPTWKPTWAGPRRPGWWSTWWGRSG